MAIVDARALRSLTVSERKSDKQTKQLSAKEDFLILSDVKHPSFGDILADETAWANLGNKRLPKIDDKVTLNGVTFYCNGRDLSYYKDNERAVVMSVRYDAKDEADDEEPEQPQGDDPESWLRWSIRTEQMTQPASGWLDLEAAKIADVAKDSYPQNSAGDPVDGIEEDVAMVRLTYTNTQVQNPNFRKLNEYVNKCNSVEWWLGMAPYTVRCMGWNGEYDQKNNRWSISVEFLYKPNSWEIRFYDLGFNELADDGVTRIAIVDKAGNPVSKPVPLDGGGKAQPLQQGSAGSSEQPLPLALVDRYLFPYPAVDFSNLARECRI